MALARLRKRRCSRAFTAISTVNWNVEQFPTFGGTDLAAFEIDGRKYLAVANSLSAEVRFRADSKIYRLRGSDSAYSSPTRAQEPGSMTLRSSPELIRLYETYTAHPDSIGFKMAAAATAAAVDDPLIVATNADIVLFPGGIAMPRSPQVRCSRSCARVHQGGLRGPDRYCGELFESERREAESLDFGIRDRLPETRRYRRSSRRSAGRRQRGPLPRPPS